MKVSIITSPFATIPPTGIGAVEKRWYYLAEKMAEDGCEVCLYVKKDRALPIGISRLKCFPVRGFERSGSVCIDLILDFVYSVKAITILRPCDILVLNTFWSPILFPFLKWKYKRMIYNVARSPKGQFRWYHFVDQFSCVSNAIAHSLKKELGEDKRIVVVNNPIDTKVFRYHEEIDNGCFVVMYHGRIHPEKGLELLFHAARILFDLGINICLKILGPVEIEKGGGGKRYVDKLKKIAGELPVSWMESTPEPQQIAAELVTSNLYCYPSVAEKGEAFGIAPLEAMGIGRAVIVSDLDCFKDFVEDGKNAYVFQHDSQNAVNQLAGIMKKLILDPDLRKRIGKNASISSQKFSIAHIAEQYLKNFGNLITEHE